MTERLHALLDREAGRLDVPPPPAAAVIAHGRRLRRTRRVAGGTAAAAALAVVATSTALVVGGGDDTRRVDPAPAPAARLGEVFSIGTEVHLDGGVRSAQIDDTSIKSLFYTSAGVVVRHGDNPWSDGGGPQRFSLVTPDGDVRPLALVTEEVYHASDPAQPYLVWADGLDGPQGAVVAHVLDVTTGEEVLTVPLPEHSGRFAPASLSGETLYIGDFDRGRTFVVDVPTGEVTLDTEASYGGVAGGVAVTDDRDSAMVVDVASGEVLLDVAVPRGGYGSFSLSPDGRYAVYSSVDGQTFTPGPADVYVVATGESHRIEGPADPLDGGLGWSADGEHLFRVSRSGTLTSCAAATGECTDTRPPLPVTPDQFSDEGETPGDDPRDDLRLGGLVYES